MGRSAGLVAASMTCALVTAAACSTSRVSAPRAPVPAAAATTPGLSDGLVTGTAFLALSGRSERASAVQLRAVSDGHVLGNVAGVSGSPTSLSMSVAPDGSVVAAENGRCTSTVMRLDVGSGRPRVIRTIPENVSDLALNPAGTKIAYLTQPTCSTRICSGTCAGAAEFNPSVLVVLDLSTGRSTRTSTDNPGHPLMSPAWSPDGTQIVAVYLGDATALLRFDARAPDFATATPIAARPGCAYIATTRTRTGFVSAETCGNPVLLSPRRLVETTATGAVQASWPLPDCIDGLTLTSTPSGSRTLVEADIGYGNAACSTPQLTRIAEIDGARLRTVTELRGGSRVRLAGY